MSILGWSAAAGVLWRRELLRAWRDRARLAAFVGSPLVFWLAIGSGFGDLGFFLPGFLVLTVMFSAAVSMMSVIEDRREGFLLAAWASPAPRAALAWGKLAGAATLAGAQGLLVLAFLPLTELRPTPTGLVAASAMSFLIALWFAALGLLLAWRMESTQAFHGWLNLLLLPMWLTSGALFASAGAHPWMRALMRWNPLSYAVAALRRQLGAGAADAFPPASVVVLVAATVALAAAAVLTVSRRS